MRAHPYELAVTADEIVVARDAGIGRSQVVLVRRAALGGLEPDQRRACRRHRRARCPPCERTTFLGAVLGQGAHLIHTAPREPALRLDISGRSQPRIWR
jgi:hypothetical protein